MLHKFSIQGCAAFILNGEMHVSIPNEDVGANIVVETAPYILDNKIKSLRLNMQTKTIFVSAQDRNNIVFRAEELGDAKTLN